MTWYEEFFAGVDAMDPATIDRWCTPDTIVRFANREPIVGRDAVREALTHLWSKIGGLRHEVVHVVEAGDRAIIEEIVHYTCSTAAW